MHMYLLPKTIPFRQPSISALASCSPPCSSRLSKSQFLLHRSRRVHSSSLASTTSFPDPTRLDLHYHLFAGENNSLFPTATYALTFLSSPPKSVNSDTVIGWLPAGGSSEPGLHDFKENGKFRVLLHSAIQTGLAEGVDEIQRNAALQLENGWMHVHDERNPPAPSRIGDPDDIIATVLVENSKILAETYQAMPSYRFCTADGIITLTPGLAAKLQQLLRDMSQKESQS